MLNEQIATAGHPALLESLGGAIERAIAGLGLGTGIAFLLGALVLGAEALRRRARKRERRPSAPYVNGKRRRQA